MDFSVFGNISERERKALEEIVENNRKDWDLLCIKARKME